MSNETTDKILDATTGEGKEFKSADQILDYKLVIDGTAGAAIKAFYVEKAKTLNAFFIKFQCADWGGATVKLQCKTQNADDTTFSDTGDIIKKDTLKIFHY